MHGHLSMLHRTIARHLSMHYSLHTCARQSQSSPQQWSTAVARQGADLDSVTLTSTAGCLRRLKGLFWQSPRHGHDRGSHRMLAERFRHPSPQQ